MSSEAKDLLQKLLLRKPSDRLSCHDALRHQFFMKNGLDIDAEEKTVEKDIEKVRKMSSPVDSQAFKIKNKDEFSSMDSFDNMDQFKPCLRKESKNSQNSESNVQDLLKTVSELKSQVSKRDEELLRMSRMYSNEKERSRLLEEELREKDKLIAEMSIKMNGKL